METNIPTLQKNPLHRLLLLVIVLMAIFAIIDYFLVSPQMGVTLALFSFFLFILDRLLAKDVITAEQSSNSLSLIALFFTLPFAVYFSGGIHSSAIAWYGVIPTGTLLIFGFDRRVLAAIGVVVISVIAFALLDFCHVPMPSYSAQYSSVSALLHYLGLIAVSFAITSLFKMEAGVLLESIKKEKQFFLKHTAQMPGFIYQLKMDKDWKISYPLLTSGFEELMGLDLDMAKANWRLINERIHPDDFKQMVASLKESRDSLGEWNYEARLLVPGKPVQWVRGNAKPERTADGGTVWYGYIHEHTQEKIAQQQLAETESNFQLIVKHLSDLVYLYDIKAKKYLFVSPNCKSVVGVDDDFFYEGKSHTDVYMHEDDRQMGKDVFDKLVDGESYDIQFRQVINGRISWLNEKSYPIKDENGKVIKCCGIVRDITAKVLFEQQLVQSKESIAQISSTINDVFFLYDRNAKRYVFMSDNCKRVLGVGDDYFYDSRNYTEEYVHPDDRAGLYAAYEQMGEGQNYEIIYRIIKNGEVRRIREKSFAVQSKSGADNKVSGIVTDITEQYAFEDKLRQSENNFKQIAETINDAFYLYDHKNNKYVYVSPNCKLVMGVADSFFYEGRSQAGELVHPDDKEKVAFSTDVVLSGKNYELDYRIIIDNKVRWLNEKSYPVMDEQGIVVKISGIVSDITKRKEDEEKMLKSQQAFEEAQQLAQIGSWEFNFFDGQSLWSREMYEITELDPAIHLDNFGEMRKKVHPDDLKLLDESFKQLVDKGQVQRQEIRLFCANGEVKYISSIGEVIRSKNSKKVIGVRGTIQDITKQKLADLAKSNFLSTMSHEIRTPINGVIGISNLLMEEELTPTQKEYVNTLSFSAQHLSTIVSDILDFSKIESGALNFEKVDFDLREITTNIFKLFESKATEKGLSYTLNKGFDGAVLLSGDYVRLSQILTNLLSNAVKFTEKGTVEFGYHKTSEIDNKIGIAFTIKDSGIGISKEQQQRIFESFRQADASVTRQFGGTGLGLTISKKLVEMQGGNIEVSSVQGQGSTFTVNLQFEKQAATSAQASKTNLSATTQKLLNGMRVLVAEDNKINALVLTRFLNKWNIEHTVTENGLEAIQLLEKESFNAVLMDLQMPVMGGRDATIAIRKNEQAHIANIPVIALTADALVESQVDLLKNGFNDCITKPFSPDALFKILKKYHAVSVA
jgi:PAS domain S-box-containing protein